MNKCGYSGGGDVAREVKLDRFLLAGIDFMGAMVVDRGVEIYKHKKKKKTERESKGRPKVSWREK